MAYLNLALSPQEELERRDNSRTYFIRISTNVSDSDPDRVFKDCGWKIQDVVDLMTSEECQGKVTLDSKLDKGVKFTAEAMFLDQDLTRENFKEITDKLVDIWGKYYYHWVGSSDTRGVTKLGFESVKV